MTAAVKEQTPETTNPTKKVHNKKGRIDPAMTEYVNKNKRPPIESNENRIDEIAESRWNSESPANGLVNAFASAAEKIAQMIAPPTPKRSNYETEYYKDHCQISNQTKPERFPKIFDALLEYQTDAKRILSFGCSHGDECFALANRFDAAEIVGYDINQNCINTARRANKFKDRVFFHSELGGTGRYDIITVLMVLFGVEEEVPRANWDKAIVQIDKHLEINGLLVIYTSEYDFESTEIAKRYKVERAWKREHNKNKKEYFCGYYRKVTDQV